MKYFLTGATGFVGGQVARQLVEAGHEVVALVRNPSVCTDLANLGISLHQGDVTDKESMRGPMAGVDGVYHVAGWYKVGVRDKSPGERINVLGTRNVLELMQELGIPKGVYTSTLAVNSDTRGKLVDEDYHYHGLHLSEYDRTKALAHEVAKQMISQGLPLVIVMPGIVYGPGDTSLLRTSFVQYLQRKLPVIPRETAYCWGYVDDIARGHILAMEAGRPGETYNLAGPPHTIVEAMHLAEQITGIPAPASVSPWVLRALSVVMSVVEKFVRLPEYYTSEGLRVLAGVTYLGDNSKARRELGFAPRPLREGLAEFLDHERRK